MSDESTTPDLLELVRRGYDAGFRRNFDAALSAFAPDAVWQTHGLGTSFEGVAAIRGFLEDWRGSYEELEVDFEELLDVGNGVIFGVMIQEGRPTGSLGQVRVRHRHATVSVWEDAKIVRVINYSDPDEARAAAERLAQERG
jgi:ketosteroid isomerase-like protein